MSATTPRFLTYSRASTYLAVPVGTLYSWVREGRIPHYRFGPRTVRFCEAQLEHWASKHHQAGPADQADPAGDFAAEAPGPGAP